MTASRRPLPREAAPRAWQRMLSGRRLDILDPSPLDIELDDIAHGIARVARWNGQTTGAHPYSVAQHCCLVEAIALSLDPTRSTRDRLAILLHDAPEYVIGDVITPLKAALGERFGEIERGLQAAVHLAFGLPPCPDPALARLIKRADRSAAFLEATRLAGFTRAEALRIFGRPEAVGADLDSLLEPWAPQEAERAFRARVRAASDPHQARHALPV